MPWEYKGIVVCLLVFSLFACMLDYSKYEHVDDLKIDKISNEKLDIYFSYYTDYRRVEFAFCAYGKVEGNVLVINRIEFPPQVQSFGSVMARYDLCSETPIAYGHSHPLGSNTLSSLDLINLQRGDKPAHILVYFDGNIRKEVFLK